MFPLLSQLISRKHQEKMQHEENLLKTYGPVIHDYLTNPNTTVDDQHGNWLIGEYSKILPKEAQESFQSHVQQMREGKAYAAATNNQPPPGPAPVGQVPGTTPPPGALGSIIAGGAAQPPTSPVQPITQAPSPLPPPPVLSPVGAPAPAAAPAPVASGWRVPPEELGRRKAAVETPVDIAKYEAMRQAQLREFKGQMEAKRGAIKEIFGENGGQKWEDITPAQYMQASAAGVNLPMLGRGMMTPMNIPGYMSGASLPEGAIDIFGKPIDPSKLYRTELDKLTRKPTAFVPAEVPSGVGFNDQGQGVYYNRFGAPGTATGTTAGSQSAPKIVSDASGRESFVSPVQAKKGESTPIAGAVNPAFAPTTGTHVLPIQTVDANGNPVTRLETVTSTSRKGGAAAPAAIASAPPAPVSGTAPAPQAGAKEFQKPFTPEQLVRHQQQLGQYNNAIGRMENIKKNLPLLNSILESGKLELQMDSSGFVRALINRSMPLTKAESDFVGDFRTMMEDINLLRGPMGATGFRGPEAWTALQAQRGQLLAKPEVTRKVIENSLTALRAQRDPLAKALGKASGESPSSTPAATHRFNPATRKIEAIEGAR